MKTTNNNQMFSRSCAIFIAVVIAANSIQASPALADESESSALTYNTIDSDYWKRIPNDLNWTAKQIAAADKVIHQDKQDIQKQLDKAKKKGAVKIKIEKEDSEDFRNWNEHLTYFPEYQKFTRRFQIIGKNSNNKKIFEGTWSKGQETYLPSSGYIIGDYLIRLKSPNCDLVDFSLLNPASWFANRCEIITPTAKEYLRAFLISRIFYPVDPAHKWGEVTSVLEQVLRSKTDYEIIDGRIHSLGIDYSLGKGGIPLSYSYPGCYNFTITPGKDKWHMTFTQTHPTPQDMANLVKLYGKKGNYHLNFKYDGCPWSVER